jgi:hypothetical protein
MHTPKKPGAVNNVNLVTSLDLYKFIFLKKNKITHFKLPHFKKTK